MANGVEFLSAHAQLSYYCSKIMRAGFSGDHKPIQGWSKVFSESNGMLQGLQSWLTCT